MQKFADEFSSAARGCPRGCPRLRLLIELGGFGRRAASALGRMTDGQLALLLERRPLLLAAWPLALVPFPRSRICPITWPPSPSSSTPSSIPSSSSTASSRPTPRSSRGCSWWDRGRDADGLQLFVLVVLALGALATPRFVLSFVGRRRMVVSLFFAWPMVHNWFVSMGMLDFALGVPLATLLLVGLNAQRRRPTVMRAVGWRFSASHLARARLSAAGGADCSRHPRGARRTWKERVSQARTLDRPPASVGRARRRPRCGCTLPSRSGR